MNCARFFIVSAFIWFSFLPCVASASGEYEQQLEDIKYYLGQLNTNINDVRVQTADQLLVYKVLSGQYAFDRYSNPRTGTLPWYLLQIAQQNQYSKEILLNILRNMTNASSSGSVIVTNIVNVGGGGADVLAGNPWWATNSAFALTYSAYSHAYPDDDIANNFSYSFPQAFSSFLSMINHRNNSQIPATYTLNDEWGMDYVRSLGNGVARRPYNWFDWMSDATRSNWVASASYTRDLLRELRALSNAVASSSVSLVITNQSNVVVTNVFQLDELTTFLARQFGTQYSNDVENAVYLGLKIEALSNALASSSVNITNILNADDILAANPWWSTNSNFAWEWQVWNPYLSPWPKDGYPAGDWPTTFPEAFSLLVSSRLRGVYPDWRTNEFWKTFWRLSR